MAASWPIAFFGQTFFDQRGEVGDHLLDLPVLILIDLERFFEDFGEHPKVGEDFWREDFKILVIKHRVKRSFSRLKKRGKNNTEGSIGLFPVSDHIFPENNVFSIKRSADNIRSRPDYCYRNTFEQFKQY